MVQQGHRHELTSRKAVGESGIVAEFLKTVTQLLVGRLENSFERKRLYRRIGDLEW
jgi:hypothetical protein